MNGIRFKQHQLPASCCDLLPIPAQNAYSRVTPNCVTHTKAVQASSPKWRGMVKLLTNHQMGEIALSLKEETLFETF